MMGSEVFVRRPIEGEAERLAELIVRFYRFNEEFDPSMEPAPDVVETAIRVSKERIKAENILLAAFIDDVMVGYIYGYITENPMLYRRKIGVLKELYVMPGYRGRGIARALIEHATRELGRLGIKYTAVEFPTMNVVAEKFYEKLGFRKFLSIYLREV